MDKTQYRQIEPKTKSPTCFQKATKTVPLVILNSLSTTSLLTSR